MKASNLTFCGRKQGNPRPSALPIAHLPRLQSNVRPSHDGLDKCLHLELLRKASAVASNTPMSHKDVLLLNNVDYVRPV
uniref:Uncharacterized protein n=1 Tax=Panagrellus redivivus TaxID=6233 RepID=A0A7E4ZR01_PANRE